ncbi:lysozyme family protein [Enterococcus cecorum]|uniref:lysozyme family protein n=2 Tax=Enterococcus cecorum TaxID=44008 RepID=UPI0032C47279
MKKIVKKFMLLVLVSFIFLGGFIIYQRVQVIKHVRTYQGLVAKITKEAGIEKYQSTILAIMMTESKGTGQDVMQSSESLTKQVGQLENQEQSIKQGTKHFKELLDYAQVRGCDYSTVLQAYNYGMDYIDYVANHGKHHTQELAAKYSKEVLAPALGNTEGKRYRYLHIFSIFHNGGYLYHNGGNYYYAKIVKWNQYQYESYEKIIHLIE